MVRCDENIAVCECVTLNPVLLIRRLSQNYGHYFWILLLHHASGPYTLIKLTQELEPRVHRYRRIHEDWVLDLQLYIWWRKYRCSCLRLKIVRGRLTYHRRIALIADFCQFPISNRYFFHISGISLYSVLLLWIFFLPQMTRNDS